MKKFGQFETSSIEVAARQSIADFQPCLKLQIVSLDSNLCLNISGLTNQTTDEIHFKHVTAMANFAFRLKDQLSYVNEHSFNNFQLRAGKLRRDVAYVIL